jgi:hypothetical protein
MIQTGEDEFTRLLQERCRELGSEIARLDEERAYLQAEYTRRESQLRERVERLEKELMHVHQILELRDGARPVAPKRVSTARVEERRIEDAVYDLLASERQGLHYSEILSRVSNAGILVSGRNPGATLVSRLIRDRRFSRPEQRGVYALREWAPDARDVGSRRKRQRGNTPRSISGQGLARTRKG